MPQHKTAITVAAVTLLGVTACSSPVPPPPVMVPTLGAAAMLITECRDIENAYILWRNKATLTIKTVIDLQLAEEPTYIAWMDEGKEFIHAAEGHADQASKDLALAVAVYNFHLATLNLDRSKFNKVDAQAAEKAFESYRNIHLAYVFFQTSTCENDSMAGMK